MITHLFGAIPVSNRDEAMAWYERLLGRPADLIPNEREAAWRMTDTGWLYVIAGEPRAGTALHTLLIDDLECFLAGLGERGIEAPPIEKLGSAGRATMLSDPDGNRLKLSEVA